MKGGRRAAARLLEESSVEAERRAALRPEAERGAAWKLGEAEGPGGAARAVHAPLQARACHCWLPPMALPPGSLPARRWLVAGPARSGASWHVDPSATSAWNTLLAGARVWLGGSAPGLAVCAASASWHLQTAGPLLPCAPASDPPLAPAAWRRAQALGAVPPGARAAGGGGGGGWRWDARLPGEVISRWKETQCIFVRRKTTFLC